MAIDNLDETCPIYEKMTDAQFGGAIMSDSKVGNISYQDDPVLRLSIAYGEEMLQIAREYISLPAIVGEDRVAAAVNKSLGAGYGSGPDIARCQDQLLAELLFYHDPETDKIWEKVYPFLDVRLGRLHTFQVYIAANLFRSIHESDGRISRTAALTHDVGWHYVDLGLQNAAFNGYQGTDYERSRYPHEKLGAQIAVQICDEMGYPADVGQAVRDIVDGHDTRKELLKCGKHMLEEMTVREADRIQRFLVPGYGTDRIRFEEMTKQQRDEYLDMKIREGLFFSDPAENIARRLLENRIGQPDPVAHIDEYIRFRAGDDKQKISELGKEYLSGLNNSKTLQDLGQLLDQTKGWILRGDCLPSSDPRQIFLAP